MNPFCVFDLEKPFPVTVLLEGLAPEVIMSTDAPIDTESISAGDNEDGVDNEYDQVTRTDATHPSAPLNLLTQFIGGMTRKHLRGQNMSVRTCEEINRVPDGPKKDSDETEEAQMCDSGMMCRWRIKGVFACVFNTDNEATDLSVLFWLYGIRCFQEGMEAFADHEYANSEIWLSNAKMAFFHLSNTGTREGYALFKKGAPPIMKGYVCKAFEMLVLAHHYMIKANIIFSSNDGTYITEVSEMGIYMATKAGHVADIAYKLILNTDGQDTVCVDAIEKFQDACIPLRMWALFLKAVKYHYDDEYKAKSVEIMNNILGVSKKYKKLDANMRAIADKLLQTTTMSTLVQNVSGWFKYENFNLSLTVLPELENPSGSGASIAPLQVKVHDFLFPS